MISRPRPLPTALTAGFWDAAARCELAIQRCGSCGLWSHPPVPVCPRCYGTALGFEPVSGSGTVYSYTVMMAGLDARFEEAAPLLVVAVELDEQDGLVVVSNLTNADHRQVQIGDRCEAVFEPLPDGAVLPQFRLSKPPEL